MLYIIMDGYGPGTASMNRILGYLKRLSENSIDTTMVFIYPNENRDVLEDNLAHITYRYLWKEYYYSSVKVIEFLLRKIYPLRFKRCLKPSDKVYIYNCAEFQHYVMGVKGVQYYHERTEHPLAISQGKGNPLTRFPMSKYFHDCAIIDGVFVISTCLRDFYISKGVNEKKVHIINMTVDTSRFDGLIKHNKERYIAYCGVIYNNKDGVDLLIKSFAIVSPAYPDVKLYIIGPVPEKTDNNAIFELIKSLKIENKVVLKGKVSALEMPQILKDAEICALNRPDGLRARAGFPTKLGEYLLSENPVVVTKVGDIPMFLEDGASALIAEPDKPDSFAAKLDWALSHVDEAKEIGKRGALVARSAFNSTTETDKIIKAMF